VLLEPIMKVDVVTPRESVGDVVADLNRRCGRIMSQDQRGDAGVLHAMVPLANLFGYGASLEALSSGQATFTLVFDHYAAVPPAAPDDEPFPPAVGMRA
jgi:elongation factor G